MSAIDVNSWLQEVVGELIRAHRAGELEDPPATVVSRPSILKRELEKHRIFVVDNPLIELMKKEVDLLIRNDAREALRVAELAESLSQLSPDTAARALGARTKAMALHVLSRYAEAVEYYERARHLYREAGRQVEMARVERAMVDALIYLSGYDEALKLAGEARQVFAAHDEKLLLAQLESNVGNIYHRLDRNQEALDCYNRAAEVFAELNNRHGLALVSFNRANVYCNLDDFRQAQALYEQAHELHCAEENQLGAAQTRYSIGYLHFLRGAYHQAMRVLHEARAECLGLGDEQTAALCILDLAEIYLQLNILDEAAQLAAQARRLFEDLGMRYEAARALTFLGLAEMRQCKPDKAERSFALAREEFAAEGNEVYLGLISLYQAELRLQRGQPPAPSELEDAIKLAGEAETIFAGQHLKAKTCAARLIKARALLSGGREAQELCENILQSCRELEAPWLRYQAHELLGDSMLAGGEIQRAHEHYAQAISFIEQIRGSIRVDEFRSAFFKDKLRVYEKLIRLCLDEEDPERHAEAFYYLESSKARTLVDLLINDLELMPLPDNEASAELSRQWQSLREKLHWHHSKMNQAEMQGKSRLLSVDQRLHEEIVLCERALSKVTRELQASDPSFIWLQRSGGIKVEELRGILAPDEIVIEYYFDAEELKIFLIDRHSLRVVSSGHSLREISEQIQKLRFQCDKFHYGPGYLAVHAERLRQSTNDCLRELWQALYAPVADLVQGGKLTFIPFGLLHNVPFQALFDGEKYLIESHEIAQAPSAMLLKLCAERAHQNYERALMIGAADENTPQITEEIRAIRALFPQGSCFTGTAATAQSLTDNATSSDILHIASHAVFRHDNPMFSAFKLADTWLNFYDICALKLPASLVVLSGCNTGASRIYAGDELMGLARGFLTAGASSLVVSLWAVNDPATAQLMTALYQKLRSGTSTRAALRAAALEIKSRYDHPYYWAPFVLISHD
jgi:CHAT domain-containing protein/tetratricopeptide (TPR) repeat protein